MYVYGNSKILLQKAILKFYPQLKSFQISIGRLSNV